MPSVIDVAVRLGAALLVLVIFARPGPRILKGPREQRPDIDGRAMKLPDLYIHVSDN